MLLRTDSRQHQKFGRIYRTAYDNLLCCPSKALDSMANVPDSNSSAGCVQLDLKNQVNCARQGMCTAALEISTFIA